MKGATSRAICLFLEKARDFGSTSPKSKVITRGNKIVKTHEEDEENIWAETF